MCPECFATLALFVTGLVSTGGATAATAKLLRLKRTAAQIVEARQPTTYHKEKAQ